MMGLLDYLTSVKASIWSSELVRRLFALLQTDFGIIQAAGPEAGERSLELSTITSEGVDEKRPSEPCHTV